jgi:uncharacterized protein YegJ (DUF2314 family)
VGQPSLAFISAENMMRSLLQAIYDFFGAKPLARVLASGVIGAVVVAWSLITRGEPEVGSRAGWLIGGASIGFLGGLLLTWPRAFPGALLCLSGLFVVGVPMAYADGSAVPLGAHLIKAGVGLGIAAMGLALLVWARRRRTYSPSAAFVSDIRSRYYVRRVAGFACLALALVTMGGGLWLGAERVRAGRGMAGVVVLLGFGGFLLYGAIRWIRDPGHGLERVPPDLEVPELADSVRRARETLPSFMELAKGEGDRAFIKFPIAVEDGFTEHLWGWVRSFNGDAFSVSLANAPFQKGALDSGERKVAVAEVEDWMVVNPAGQIRGAYSIIALMQCLERDGKWLSPRMRRQRALLVDAPVV